MGAPRAADRVIDDIRGRIASGALQPGHELPAESALMIRYGVSRYSLREALRVLEAEGLLRITRGPRGGAVVLAPGAEVLTRYVGFLLESRRASLDDVHAARTMIETWAVITHARAPHRFAPTELLANIEAAEAASQRRDVTALLLLNAEFHRMLVHGLHSPLLTLFEDVTNGLFTAAELEENPRRSPLVQLRRARHGIRAHRQVLDLVAAGEVARASDLWTEHCDTTGGFHRDSGALTPAAAAPRDAGAPR